MAKDESQIKTSCAQCGEMMLFPERHRGMKGRCPSCSAILTIGEYVYRDKFDGELTLADDDGGSAGISDSSDARQYGFSASETDRIRSERFKTKKPKEEKQKPSESQPSHSSEAPVLVPVHGAATAPIVGVPVMAGPTAGHPANAWSAFSHGQGAWYGAVPGQVVPGQMVAAQNVPALIPIAWPTARATPAPQPAASNSLEVSPEAVNAALATSFRGSVPRRPFALSQRLGVYTRTLLSLLPLAAYLLVTFWLLALLVWHTVTNSFLLPDLDSGLNLMHMFTVPIYLAGIVAFGGLAWLSCKLMFAPRHRPTLPTSLPREASSRVYSWAEKIAESIGCPKPNSIALDSSIDPRFDFVAKKAETPRGYQLVIGAPLIAATTLPQLTAVVAQTMALRVRSESPAWRRLARGVWRWFESRSNEPDLWDERIEKMATEEEGVAGAWYWALAGGAPMIRKCLWLGERGEAIVVSPLERQWALDADYYAIRLTGGNVFEQALRRLRVIRSAWRATLERARQDRADGKSIPNLPKVLADNLKRMPSHVEAQLAATADSHETERFSKLPSDRDRIAAARKVRAIRLFECELASVQLFDDFETLGRKVTRRSAVEIYGSELAGTNNTADDSDEAASEAEPKLTVLTPSTMGRDQFFFHAPMEMRAWQPIAGSVGAKRPWPEIVEALTPARAMVAAQKSAHIHAYTVWTQARLQAWEGEAAVLLMEHNLPLIGTPLVGRVANYQAACELVDGGRLHEAGADQQLRQFERNAATRLATALTALRDPQVLAELGEDRARLARVDSLLGLLLRVSQHLPPLQAAQRQLALLNLLHTVAARSGRPLAASQTLNRRQPIADEALRCREALGDIEFPFETTVRGLSVAEYLLPQAILPRITMESIPAIGRMADRLQWVHDRIVNELCGTALDIERVSGIE